MFKTTIGLEIHVQLSTKSKMFCGCLNQPEGRIEEEPNTRVCPVCMGFPGTLPIANIEAIKKTIMTGIALNCEIPNESKFDRKHYFYPDLPKNFQISQYDQPFCRNGELEISSSSDSENMSEESRSKNRYSSRLAVARSNNKKIIRINRVHLEEDAGKLVHPEGADYSLVDMNRCGTPLMEVVTEPDIDSPELAKAFLKELRLIVRYLEVSNADMEKGQLRCDANISVQKKENGKWVTSPIVEIKNMNSFRAVEGALKFEERRLRDDFNEEIKDMSKKTRAWVEKEGITRSMRRKEEASDYRYFPEPDVPPILIDKKVPDGAGVELKLVEIRSIMPALPEEKRKQYANLGMGLKEIETIVSNKSYCHYLDDIVAAGGDASKTVDLMINEKTGTAIKTKNLITALKLENEGIISHKILKSILPEMMEDKNVEAIIEQKGLKQLSDEGELEKVIGKIIKQNPGPAKDYKNGKTSALGYLVGQVMKETKGQANPQLTNKILTDLLK